MNYKVLLFLGIFILAFSGYSQNTSGKVYAGDKRVPGVLVENRTQNRSMVTTDEGDFSIAARVVELNENLNELDEVRLTEAPKEKKFSQEEYTAEVNTLIQNDIKQNPQKYRPQYTSNGVDFIMLAKRFMGLFKKDPSKQQKEYAPITYEQYQELFATNDYFDQQFLTRQLEIEPYYQNLFFEYCDAMQLKGELLLPEHQLDLLDALMKLSANFKAELENFNKESEGGQ